MKLSERLEALVAAAEPTHDCARDHNAPDAECVFVDVRPAEFEALIREAAELARRVEGAPVADIREDGTNGGESALLSAATRAGYYQGQRVRLVPDSPTPPAPGHEREGGNG